MKRARWTGWTWKLVALLALAIAPYAFSYTIVGNADEGDDLEDLAPIEKGPILEARDKAASLLEKLNVEGIRGLGILIPEVKTSALFLAKEDEKAKYTWDKTQFHSDDREKVFARTVAQPHAATRFFPIANSLSQDQLIALHIHEALHRALPQLIREDESIVSQITLAITSPGANRDRVDEVMKKHLRDDDLRLAPPIDVASSWSAGRAAESSETSANIGYTFRQFLKSSGPSNFAINQMHTVHSDLYAFGSKNFPLGFGLEASMISGQGGTYMGPLGISAKCNLLTERNFTLGLFGIVSLNVLSSDELKNSPHGRDVVTLGASLKKNFGRGYVENFLSVTPEGKTKQTVGLIDYEHSYGTSVSAKVRAGLRLWKLDVGGFGELLLSDYYRVNGGNFTFDSGRYRLLSAGPELAFVESGYSVSLQGRFLVNGTKDANFDYLGNLMGTGTAQGSIGLSASVFF